MPDLNIYRGACHCQAIRVQLRTAWKPEQFPLRECDCSFCRRHGARTVRDPEGEFTLFGQPHWYRFGMGTADFLLCSDCGVYLASVIRVPEGDFATCNTNCLEIASQLEQQAKPVNYSDESQEERVKRRVASWTPFVHQPVGAESRGASFHGRSLLCC